MGSFTHGTPCVPSGRPASLNQASTRSMGQSTRTRPKDWTANPSLLRNTQAQTHTQKMKVFITLTLLAMLMALVMGGPFPKRKSDSENMDIYRKYRSKFGTSPKVECRGSSDCRMGSDRCPEHDCLPARNGRSFCTWQSY